MKTCDRTPQSAATVGRVQTPAAQFYQTLSRVKSRGGAAYLLTVVGLIAYKDLRRFDISSMAASIPWTLLASISMGTGGP